ncbi:hypothetical protein P691DRAFT_440391 [Macrolepiota fuliginosa MF-IS2]|uniref:Uncharacterized protein n=1 Tax=Macrolepiota fuliginosa MF-IS2 TaxID=1400762 RepID=A0A9P5XGU6_9AGAR|nr:hypothetical protein P691DRAFT_440391 [Macrolepiota fuliginosa MF-IS2]
MTEYNYSPDAYERYLATQQRIARWVDNTNQHRPSNPFVLSPTSESQSMRDLPPPTSSASRAPSGSLASYNSKARSRSSDTAQRRPGLSDSHNTPVPTLRSSAEDSRSSPSHHISPSSRSRSTRHSHRSSSSSRYTSRSSRTHSTTTSFKTVTPNSDGPTYVKRSDTQPILVPIDGGRGGYVIVPPRGTRMEVLVSSCLLLLLFLAWWATSDVDTPLD